MVEEEDGEEEEYEEINIIKKMSALVTQAAKRGR